MRQEALAGTRRDDQDGTSGGDGQALRDAAGQRRCQSGVPARPDHQQLGRFVVSGVGELL